MNWLLDLGNTRLKWAPLNTRGELSDVVALPHADLDFSARFEAVLAQTAPGDAVWLASVAKPEIAQAVRSALTRCGLQLAPVQVRSRCAGVQLAEGVVEQLGVDRFFGLLGARALASEAQLLVSIGSAITVDLLDAEGRHLGGVIAATAEHQRSALAERFAVLDRPPGRVVDFAGNTADAVASGCQASVLGLIERCQRQAQRRLGHVPRLLLSGGGAASLSPSLELPHEQQPYLVMQGLARYAASEAGDG